MSVVAPGDRAEFRALVDELADLESRRTGTGGLEPKDAARMQQVERRLLQLVTTELPQDERRRFVRLPCDLPVTLRKAGEAKKGVIVDVGVGGVFVETAFDTPSGQLVDLEIERRAGSLDHGLRVKGKVVWGAKTRRTGRAGLGIAFTAHDEPSERRLRRFVIELLRKRLPDA